MTSTEEIKEGDPGVGAGTVCQPEAQGSLEAANCTSRTLEPGRPEVWCVLLAMMDCRGQRPSLSHSLSPIVLE